MNLRNTRAWFVAAAAVAVSLALAAAAGAVTSSTVYDATPSPLPPNVASLGFEATSTSEFGDQVNLAGTNRVLNAVTVTMSDWALHSSYPALGDAAGWTHPITVNIYSVDHSSTTPAAGALLATQTQTFSIPWRPEASVDCANGAWRASDGQCYNGLAFNITTDFSSLHVVLPTEVIVGIAFNTADYGYSPIHLPGPYNSLNVGVPDNQVATTGADANPDAVFWNTTYPGVSDAGTFHQDSGWAPNGTVAIKIVASPPAVAPPTNKDQCKNGGWKVFNDPSYDSQGACVSFVQSH